ncbi:PREDICTED: uncharacterized protein LOC109221239 [Nicotiana attenuata]|uniref:uncharacterized protein LOC109221239 n=1 Tax=Nicotiana attenuata TaxID=49451 RepID=UPI000904EAE8|nr:PREDICTED: uncharacterized protein LOC109221239 [Nicotiana attenuata]
MPQYPKCHWKRITIDSKALPRHQFILWLAMHKKLATVDRLRKWGISIASDCVLCEKDTEGTMEHLFFECDYSRNMWATLLKWLGERHQIGSWNAEIEWLEKRSSCRVRAHVLRFLFAAVIYHVWTEKSKKNSREDDSKPSEGEEYYPRATHTRAEGIQMAQ